MERLDAGEGVGVRVVALRDDKGWRGGKRGNVGVFRRWVGSFRLA